MSERLPESEQRPDVNERLDRLELIVELVPDVVKATRALLRVLGDMAEAMDSLAQGQAEVVARVTDLQPTMASTEQTFEATRNRILERIHDLEICLASIEERLSTLEV